MIQFNNLNKETPYLLLKTKYDEAIDAGQKNVEAILICSLDKNKNEVDARFVNLKYITNNEWFFFTNYNSPKSLQFQSHNQIAAVFYWSEINVQIRIKALIKKISKEQNLNHFNNRDVEKNALAISSQQSEIIDSYESIQMNHAKVMNRKESLELPDYWGGFSFVPYYFEFWEGNDKRLNKRRCFRKEGNSWNSNYLQA